MTEHLTLDSSPIGDIDITAKSIVDTAYTGPGPKYPIDTLNIIASATIKYCEWAEIRSSYVAGHMLLETGAFSFGGDVIPEQYNFGGIGTTGGGVQGLYFPDAETGVMAMVSHECGYIYGAVENWPEAAKSLYQTNPRTKYVAYGPNAASVETIGDLGSGKWAASPSVTYAPSVMQWANKTIDASAGQIAPEPPSNSGGETRLDMIDLVSRLRRNNAGGPNYKHARKVGIVFHYNGPPPNPDALTQYINDANYHCNMDWGGGSKGDGIMYHYGIQSGDDGEYPDGTIFILRYESDVLWHCGSWVPGGNETGIAINMNIGQGQYCTEAAIQAANRLCLDIMHRHDITRDMVKGHKELSSTACPGTIMDDVIYPFRADELGGGTIPPVETDRFIHENGYIIGGGIKSIIEQSEGVSHTYRMRTIGYAISNEGDGYLFTPETDGDGNESGRYYIEDVVLQKFERQTFMHQPSQPAGEWQDTSPLTNRGYILGFPTDKNVLAILNQPTLILNQLTTMLPEHPLS